MNLFFQTGWKRVKLNFSINIGFPKKGILKMVFQVPFGNQTWRAGNPQMSSMISQQNLHSVDLPATFDDTDTGGLLITLLTNY